jgi:hypothetical protein
LAKVEPVDTPGTGILVFWNDHYLWDFRDRPEPFRGTALESGHHRTIHHLLTVEGILEMTGEKQNYKQYYFPDPEHLMIYLKGGHILMTLETGRIELTKIRNRPVFNELDYLHYNKPKKIWTWFSDLYAVSLILIAVSGLFLIKGRKGISGRGGVLTIIGILVPLAFLFIYLWL